MKNLNNEYSFTFFKLSNALIMTFLFGICWYGYYAKGSVIALNDISNMFILAVYLIFYLTFSNIYDAFEINLKKIEQVIFSQFLSASISDCLIFGIICLLSQKFVNMLPGLEVLGLQICLAVIWSVCIKRWYFQIIGSKNTIVIYQQRYGIDRLIEQYGLNKTFKVNKVHTAELVVNNMSLLSDADTVFLSEVSSKERNSILQYCVEKNIEAYILPSVEDAIIRSAKETSLFHLPMLKVGRYNPSMVYLISKRLFDIVCSFMALVILSPLMAILAMIIRSDGGPAFYKQVRLTKDGKEFEILKFRSMRVDAEKDGIARLSTGDKDSRITPVGHFIRACRFDELPQFINILKGDLSIVGPRPERPEIEQQYCQDMPEFHLRLQAKAGLTGFAQVYGKYNTTPKDKLQMDLMYISHPSLWNDIKLCFATIKILFEKDSTEGISEGSVIAENVSSTMWD